MALTCAVLSACAAPQQVAPLAQEAEQSAADVPVEPDVPSLFYRWPLDSGTLISPPVDIQTQAISACRARGYDTGFMIHIGIDGDDAVAEFGCRGAD